MGQGMSGDEPDVVGMEGAGFVTGARRTAYGVCGWIFSTEYRPCASTTTGPKDQEVAKVTQR
jgi:hypothetical protein